jgi:hypothetical protein
MKVRTVRLVTLLVIAVMVGGLLPHTAQAADKPAIMVAPTWHPDLQLTSIDGSINPHNGKWNPNKADGIWDPGEDGVWGNEDDDDLRYVEAQVMVTTSVEFWAVEMTCTVNNDVLEAYTDYDQTGSPMAWHDDMPMVNWGPAWGGWGAEYADYIPYDNDGLPAGFKDKGNITFTATRMAPATPLGMNGTSYTFLLATLRFRVKNQGSPFSGSSPIKCKSTFLDRDGKSVLRPKYKAPANLAVLSGYVIEGNVYYQARSAKAGIGVICNDNANYTAVTNLRGDFKLANIRELGHFDCRLFGNITDPTGGYQPDLYLSTWASFNLGERGSFTLLPVELKGGDLDLGGFIDWGDITLLTSNWGLSAGDVNGDGKADKSDLAIVAGNQGWNDGQMGWHVLYDLPRVSVPFADSRVWRGDYQAGEITQQLKNIKSSQFHWATLSPEGKMIAFVLSNGKADPAERTYELYKADTKRGRGKAVIKNKDLGYDAFAPSWSPDGTRIAFVRSWYSEDGRGYLHNEGYLSVVDADGRNYRNLGETRTGIFPPAWLDENTLVYGCNQGLCLYDLTNDTTWRWSNNIPQQADMPVMMNGNLYYRMTANGGPYPRSSSLRYAELDYSVYPPAVSAYTQHPGLAPGHSDGTYYNRPTFVHTDVVYASTGPAADYELVGLDEMDYYDVNWYGNDIMFNTFFDSSQFNNAHFRWDVYEGGTCPSGTCYPEWDTPYLHRVDGQVSNPAWEDRDPANASTVHALRATLDWVP